MEIVLTAARSIRLPSGATQVFPAGWSGEVADEHAAAWIADGVATRIIGAAVAGALTPRQTAILAKAADEIDAVSGAAKAAAQHARGDEDHVEVDLDGMSDEQLAAIAADLGIRVTAKLKKSREALIAAIEAKAAEMHEQAAATATDGDDVEDGA